MGLLSEVETELPAKWEKAWRIFLVISLIEGLAVIGKLLSVPADPKNSLLGGYSLYRLLILAAILLLEGIFVFLLIRTMRQGHGSGSAHITKRQPMLSRLQRWLLGAAGLTWMLMLFLELYNNRKLEAPYQRLAPLLLWLLLIFLQASLLLLVFRDGFQLEPLRFRRSIWVPAGIAFAICLIVGVGMLVTGIGLVPDEIGWGAPGVPLREGQLWLTGAMLLVGLIFTRRHKDAFTGDRSWLDPLLSGGIWLAAMMAWLAIPLQTCYFALEPRAPNWEIYPFSDAGFYDYSAQSILDGNGFLAGRIVPRPLYILLLAVFHAIGGQEYGWVVFMQTTLLATFPVILYLLGKKLHSRATGLVLALLAILREANQIAATRYTTVSNSKLLLSDFPTALGVGLFTLLTVTWLSAPEEKRWRPLVVGGVLGLTALVRTQALILAPVVFLVALIRYWPKWRRLIEAGMLFSLGTALCLFPWLWRNWQLTGQVLFDQPGQVRLLALRYDTQIGNLPIPEENENEAEFTQRMSEQVRQFALAHPGFVVRFITAHFLNNLADMLLVLPWRSQADSLLGLVWVLQDDWTQWPGQLSAWQFFLISMNLGMICIGIGTAWRKLRWAGLVPLAIAMGYSLSNAIARNSGWRYILPADWVGYVYFGIGLVECLTALGETVRILPWTRVGQVVPPPPLEENSIRSGWHRIFQWTPVALFGLLFLVIGATLPLAERVVPVRFPQKTREQLTTMLLDQPVLKEKGINQQMLAAWLQQEKVEVYWGKALSPRFYKTGEGEPGNDWQAYIPRKFSRLGFILLDQGRPRDVLLRMEKSPGYFPNTSVVIVAGCHTKRYLDAVLVIVLTPPGSLYLAGAGELPVCK